jgi:hypothetical protein
MPGYVGDKVAVITFSALLVVVMVLGGCVTTNPLLTSAPTSVPRVALASGIYEFEVGNSLYPKSRGASVGFQRYLTTGEEVTGSLQWKGSDPIRYKWSLYIYAPDGSSALSWSGIDLEHNFCFTPTTPGIYKIEILKRDFPARRARLTIDPPDWNRWGKD